MCRAVQAERKENGRGTRIYVSTDKRTLTETLITDEERQGTEESCSQFVLDLRDLPYRCGGSAATSS